MDIDIFLNVIRKNPLRYIKAELLIIIITLRKKNRIVPYKWKYK